MTLAVSFISGEQSHAKAQIILLPKSFAKLLSHILTPSAFIWRMNADSLTCKTVRTSIDRIISNSKIQTYVNLEEERTTMIIRKRALSSPKKQFLIV